MIAAFVSLGLCCAAQAQGVAAPAEDEDVAGPRLLGQPALVPVTPSREYEAPPARLPLPPDGSMTIDRRCQATRDPSGWVLLRFLEQGSRSSELPRWALPCELLEAVERTIANQPETVFRITGENLLYRDQGFVLLTKVTVEVSVSPPVAAPPPKPAMPPAAPMSKPVPHSRPASAPASRPGATSGDVFQALLRDKPVRPLAPPTRPADPIAPAPSVAPQVTRAVEQTFDADQRRMIVDRVVRLLPAGVGKWKEARFEADNTLLEPPLRLIPCRTLERTEGKAEAGRAKFKVSGLVTRYKGRQYLLLRKIVPVRDLGQF